MYAEVTISVLASSEKTPPSPRSHPQLSVTPLTDAGHVLVEFPPRRIAETNKTPTAIVSVKAVPCTNPQNPLTILNNCLHRLIVQQVNKCFRRWVKPIQSFLRHDQDSSCLTLSDRNNIVGKKTFRFLDFVCVKGEEWLRPVQFVYASTVCPDPKCARTLSIYECDAAATQAGRIVRIVKVMRESLHPPIECIEARTPRADPEST